MIYIKLDEDMNLVTTVWEPIYRGDHLNQKITYLIPKQVNDIDMLTSTVYLSFIRADGEPDIVMLNRLDEMYKETYYQYVMPVTCKLSRFAGEIVTWIQIYSGSASNPAVAKRGENVLQITESKDIDNYIGDWRGDKIITALYQMKKQTDDNFERVNENIETITASKADNLIFNSEDNTIQLTSEGVPVGSRIFVSTASGKMISSVSLTTDGELVVFFDDGTYSNVGKVSGDDGKVYVPHIDAHKVLTFTIEDNAGEIPEPVDLISSDNWENIDNGDNIDDIEGNGLTSEYVWEDI